MVGISPSLDVVNKKNRVRLMKVSRSNYNHSGGREGDDTQRSIWYNIDNDVIT